MATEILMPQLGMGMTEGTILSWLVPEGAKVKKGDAVLEFETDKVTASIESPGDGVVHRVAREKTTVPVQQVVGLLLAQGESPPTERDNRHLDHSVDASPAPATSSGMPSPAGAIRSSPAARRLAAEHGVDLASIAGSGPGGRIVEADILAAVDAPQASAPATAQRILRRLPLSGRRSVIAQRIMASLHDSAQLTITREVDASELVLLRETLLGREDELGVRVAYDALLAKALAVALTEQPTLNAVVESDAIVVFEEVDVGVAMASDAGVITPVVRNAERLALIEVAERIDDFAKRAASNSLLPDELAGGTVTITNLGMYGVDTFTPILNAPQSAILGVGRIAPRPTVMGGKLAIQPTFHLSLTWDHRVADGAQAAQLLARLAELVADRAYLSSLT